MLNFTGSSPKPEGIRHAEIRESNETYSVFTWVRNGSHVTQWVEAHDLKDWLKAFSIATKWLDTDYSWLE